MNKQSNGGPVGPQKQTVTRSDLRRHSPTLYRALRALQRKHPSLTSEQFWKAIHDHWTREHLNRAATSYARTNRLTVFTKLVAKASEVLPQAGPDGFFEADGERWGTRSAFARTLRISITTVSSRVVLCGYRDGKNILGKRCDFYALSDVKKACADLLADTPKADGEGSFLAGGERWGTLTSFSKRFGISYEAIATRISSFRSQIGKNASGKPCPFYALSDVKKACADLLADTPKADGEGSFLAGGERWGTLTYFANKTGLARGSILIRLTSCRSRKGKNSYGKPCSFYAVSDVKRACADILKKKKRRRNRP